MFDLQQVIYLPRSNDGQIFYKRRLANYNFTIYNLVTRDCNCYVWNEVTSKRGSAEISTCLYLFLKESTLEKGAKEVHLFCDGCADQSKNTIVVAMLHYAINTLDIDSISLRFFETNHGQSEGDSAHSTIENAINHSGDLFMPSQLVSVIRISRTRPRPYIVKHMESAEFLNFKKLSTDLRILKIRKDNEQGDHIKWNEMKEILVEKNAPQEVKFKTSHLQENFRSFSLGRIQEDIFSQDLAVLNKIPPKISNEKYNDLVSLCGGDTPVIKHPEHTLFYRSLPHNATRQRESDSE